MEDESFLEEFRRRHIFWAFLWRVTCDYGRSMLRWALVSLVLALIFAGVYCAFGPDNIAFDVTKLEGNTPGFRAYLYYSIVTFTTLGFGDIVPLTDWARLAVGVEVILGYIMLGGLISIFANKVARRA